MRVFELAAFLTLSGAIHVAAVTLAPLGPGGSAGGDGGAGDISLQSATPTLAAMVAAWGQSPEIGDAPVLTVPSLPPATVMPPSAETLILQTPLADLPTPQPDTTRPSVDTRLPAPLIPLAQPAPPALAAPTVSQMAPRAPIPDIATPPLRAEPTRPSPTARASLPQVDTTPPTSRLAPDQSARPTLRPDRPTAAPTTQSVQTASRPAQKTRGNGQSSSAAQAPKRKAPAASGPSQAQTAQAQREWGTKITRALRRAHRPPRGEADGTVTLAIALSPSGRVQGVSITGSSGNARLDQAALKAVQRARFPRAPGVLTKPVYRFSQRLTVSR